MANSVLNTRQESQDNITQEKTVLDNVFDIVYTECDTIDIVEKVMDALTIDKLERATCVAYYFDSGSIPEPWTWSCHINVKRNTVNLTVDGIYDEIFPITLNSYMHFINELADLDIKKVIYEDFQIDHDGSNPSFVSVYHDKEKLFEIDLYQDMRVINLFIGLLPQQMRRIVEDPGRFVHDFYEKPKEYISIDEDFDCMMTNGSSTFEADPLIDYINDIIV